MTILINFYNQLGAGPKNISLNFINHLTNTDNKKQFVILVPNHVEYKQLKFSESPNVQLVRLPKYNQIFLKGMYRLYLEFFLIPSIVKKHRVSSILAFGNFLITPLKIKKIVLLHHPYLFDDALFNALNFRSKLVERLKRLVFAMTLRNVDVVVVQSEYVKNAFSTCWRNYSKQLEIIPNPISDNFPSLPDTSLDKLIDLRLKSMSPLRILYVSRYSPHKNHAFLLLLSKALARNNIDHIIYVTLDIDILGVKEFMEQAQQGAVHIINLGEIPQSELEKHYKTSHLFIFPSESETFGNPLVEAMKYGLPIIVPNLSYAHSVVGMHGLYYERNDVKACVGIIKNISEDAAAYQDRSYKSYKRFQQFPTVSEWVGSYMRLIS